ncbi:MAG: class I SAM-dependent methyltransferase [Planctomycetota bacterium]
MIRTLISPHGSIKIQEDSDTHPFSPLAQLALDHLPLTKGLNVLDLGTGSGVYAIIAAQMGCTVLGTDIHEEILAKAQENATVNGISGIEWKKTPYFEGLEGRKFDLIVANLPQTPAPKPISLAKWGGPFGRSHLEIVLRSAPLYLYSGGILILTQLGLSGFPERFRWVSPFFEIKILGELKRRLSLEEYEQHQPGLWNYLMDLRAQGESEILEDSGHYFCYGRIFQYKKHSS